MSYATNYQAGQWNAYCSMCGRQKKSGELLKHWQGQYRCQRCWEPRHPQDFVRNLPPELPIPWSQNTPPGDLPSLCTPNGQSAVPGTAEPGCMIPGYVHPFFDPSVTF